MHIAQGMKCYHLHCARDLWYVNYADNLEIVYHNITMKSCYSYGGNWTPLQRQGLTMIHNHVPVGCLCMATNDRPVYANDEKSLNPESGAQTNLPIWPLISGISTTQSHSIVDKWLGNTRIHSKSHWLYYSIRLWSCIAYHFCPKQNEKMSNFHYYWSCLLAEKLKLTTVTSSAWWQCCPQIAPGMGLPLICIKKTTFF